MSDSNTGIPDLSPQFDDTIVDELLSYPESIRFEVKRVAGKNLTRALESIVAFANTEGGFLVLGLEDPEKANGRDRVYGIQENASATDELLKLVQTRITPALPTPARFEFGCTLRDGSIGSIAVWRIDKSEAIHSILLDGTWQRMEKGNKELVAEEITRLSLERGTTTAEQRLANVDFDLLDTDYWRQYASRRKLTRPIAEALMHLGLAKKNAEGELRPTWAAVLLFAEEPGGLLSSKAAIRIFHYHGEFVEYSVTPNLLKPPITISGPLHLQIADAYRAVIEELASGVQMGPFGFEIAQKYPARVIKEAITNAVIHRDYSISADIHIRIFATGMDITSPGALPGNVTAQNMRTIGSFSRNPLIVANLREFPQPPNLDAGEGVRMMFQTMDTAGLYPPIYFTRASTGKDEVRVVLFNFNRASVWDQVADCLQKYGSIGNAEVRQILGSENTLAASKLLKEWVNLGILEIANPEAGKRIRRYRLPELDPQERFFSDGAGKQLERQD